MNSGRSIARSYRDVNGDIWNEGASPVPALWLVFVLVLVSASWPLPSRIAAAPTAAWSTAATAGSGCAPA